MQKHQSFRERLGAMRNAKEQIRELFWQLSRESNPYEKEAWKAWAKAERLLSQCIDWEVEQAQSSQPGDHVCTPVFSHEQIRSVLSDIEAGGQDEMFRIQYLYPALTRDRLHYEIKANPRKPISAQTKARVFARDGLKCCSCGSTELLQVDHMRPHAHGGSDEIDNLQTLCRQCNADKGAHWDGAY